MYVWIERFGIDGGDGRSFVPRDAKVFARRSVGRERDDLSGGQTFAREIVLQPLACGGGESVGRDPGRMAHRTEKQWSVVSGQWSVIDSFLTDHRPLTTDHCYEACGIVSLRQWRDKILASNRARETFGWSRHSAHKLCADDGCVFNRLAREDAHACAEHSPTHTRACGDVYVFPEHRITHVCARFDD